MRDLPPQAKSLELDLPAPTFLDLPLRAVVSATVPTAPEVARPAADDGPPTSQRPHAAPVGSVRLLS